MPKIYKTVNLIVFGVWIVLISLVLYKNYTGIPLEKAEALKKSFETQTYWYDIYAGTKKLGFAKTTFDKAGNEIIIKQEKEMKVFKDGRETLFFEKLKCLCDMYYSIKSFEYTHHFGDEKGIKATGEVEEDYIIFFLESSEKRKTFKTPTKGRNFYFHITFLPVLVQKGLAPGSVFTIPILDFVNLSINEIKVDLDEIRPIKVGANILSLYKFKSRQMIWWSNENGIIVKEEYPTGITLYSQTKEIARDTTDRIIFDYTSLPFLKSHSIIQNPEGLKRLKVRIKGLTLDTGLYEKSLVTFKNDSLTITKEDLDEIKKKSYKLPFDNKTLNQYLKADDWVLSDNKTVKDNAYNMAAIEKNDAFRLTRYLNSNMLFTVRPMPMFVLSNSMDIFESHLGDYLERIVMFASFARAAGLPTRLIGGVVYLNGYFYFHAWPEVWFDKWIPVDPTLAQFPADVMHIPLREGTLKDITSIVNELQNIDIQILEAS